MVLDRKTNFFLGKTKNTQNNIFLETIWPDSKKMVFWVFPKVGFSIQNHLFPKKKLVVRSKTFFLLVGFSAQSHLFARENQKNHLLRVWLKRVFFFVFLLFP